MADRYQDRPFPADEAHGRGNDPHSSSGRESDPLAELARLIGQTDPFGKMGQANQPAQAHASEPASYEDQPYAEDEHYTDADDGAVPAGPPSWMQRAARQEAPLPQEHPSPVHPLQRMGRSRATPLPIDRYEAPPLGAAPEPDPSRYDDALYGRIETGEQEPAYDQAYEDDAYAYQDSYDDQTEAPSRKRRGGLMKVVAVLALALVGTGGAFAYRTYIGAPRRGDPPIIKADATPTKVIPAPSDGTAKAPDRMATGDGAEKIVPREEAPVDVNARSGPRVVFPPLTPNANPPPAVGVATVGAPTTAPATGNGTAPNSEPRRIKTLSVRGDQPDTAALPVTNAQPPQPAKPAAAKTAAAVPAPAATRGPPSAANASANAPLSLTPQNTVPTTDTRTRVANTGPVQTAPAGAGAGAGAGGGGYVVQVSSQRNEADAQMSYRALQGKFPAVLGSRAPLIKKADLGDKGIYYRAMVGPFGSTEEASQFCSSLKSAGGQCVVQRN